LACYGALQEAATFVAYRAQRGQARAAGDKVLEVIFHLVRRDEAAHGGFYRSLVELKLAHDRAGTVDVLAYVLANFKMPGDGLIANRRCRRSPATHRYPKSARREVGKDTKPLTRQVRVRV
jgi:Fatty acid desaturase